MSLFFKYGWLKNVTLTAIWSISMWHVNLDLFLPKNATVGLEYTSPVTVTTSPSVASFKLMTDSSS